VQHGSRPRPPAETGVTLAAACLGVTLIAAAAAANQSFLDHHFLPSFFIPRDWYVLIETIVRACIGATGVSLLLGRSRVARLLTRAPGTTLRVIVAGVLALSASELALRLILPRSTEWLAPQEEPLRLADPRLGWTLAPSRTGVSTIGGRTIEYTIDDAGYRVARADQPVDPGRPTIVFAGESVMFGEGLMWEESIPAQAGAMLHVPSANLAVHGYSTDQIYLRLERELPRFRQPVAVVTIFMTELFGRNLDTDRPHLAEGLVWQPAQHRSRLKSLATMLVPYRRTATVEQGVGMTRDVLRAIVQLARAHDATPLIVVPQFGPEDDAQGALRDRIFGDDIPNVVVRLDPDWRLSWDRHPNARGAHAIAAAIASRLPLRTQPASSTTSPAR
jgi:hypothetical protein